jgi:hypothetical protein
LKSPPRKQSPQKSGPARQSFGYSGTPLVQKLGIKPGARTRFVSAPPQLSALLGPLPAGAKPSASGKLDFALLFTRNMAELAKNFVKLRDRLESNGMLWVSWPKKTSGMVTDLTESAVREFGLRNGLVDVKVCAIDDTWSGLKFVRRLADR